MEIDNEMRVDILHCSASDEVIGSIVYRGCHEEQYS